MIRPFAIEPELVAKWGNLSDYRFFIRAFGWGQPRILAEYPQFKKWQSMVLKKALSNGTTGQDLTRVVELTNQFAKVRLIRSYSEYDGNRSWLENAENEVAAFPFHAILAVSNPRQNTRVIQEDRIGIGRNNQWHLPESARPQRNAAAMSACVTWMLSCARVIVFIDPLFRPEEQKWRAPLQAFLCGAVRRGPHPLPEKIELHVSADRKKAPSPEHFEAECRKYLAASLPAGMCVTVFRWKKRKTGKRLHDRHILTNLGGVTFGIGLDEGDPGEEVRVALMKQDDYEEVWRDYRGNPPAFDPDAKPFDIAN